MNETMIVFVIPQFIPKGGQDLTSNPLLAQKVFFFWGAGFRKLLELPDLQPMPFYTSWLAVSMHGIYLGPELPSW